MKQIIILITLFILIIGISCASAANLSDNAKIDDSIVAKDIANLKSTGHNINEKRYSDCSEMLNKREPNWEPRNPFKPYYGPTLFPKEPENNNMM